MPKMMRHNAQLSNPGTIKPRKQLAVSDEDLEQAYYCPFKCQEQRGNAAGLCRHYIGVTERENKRTMHRHRYTPFGPQLSSLVYRKRCSQGKIQFEDEKYSSDDFLIQKDDILMDTGAPDLRVYRKDGDWLEKPADVKFAESEEASFEEEE